MNSKRKEKEFLKAYEEYSEALFRHSYFRVYNRDRAKEVVQETFMKAWDYVREGNEVENMRAFLYQVATNIIIDEARKKKKRVEVSLENLQEGYGFDPGEDTRERMIDKLEGKLIMGFLNDLDEKYREAVYMRYIDNLQPREIALITGESENVVSVRIHRGLKRLRRIIDASQGSKE